MMHLTEQELILHYYGESEQTGVAAEHLAACESCRVSFASLGRVLDAMSELPVPERAPDYGRRVWRAIEPKIAATRTRRWTDFSRWLQPRPWAVAAAVASLLVAAFWAGRVAERSTPQVGIRQAALTAPVRERIMLLAVGDHLEQSQMVLVELLNSGANGPLDISGEQQRAEDLVGENRLYRQAALRIGDKAVSNLLEELERVLLEIAHSPSKLDSDDLQQIRQRIEAEGILFKIRVVGTNLRERERPAASKAL